MAGLEISIGGDASGFESELGKVERQLRTLESRREIRVRAGLDLGDLDRRVNETRTRLDGLRTSMNSVGTAINGAAPRIANGSNALMQFSRIAQDAPFGIIGIGNNITATVEAFGHLRQSTGSAGGALRAMATSIMGTGGILLAVSLVTTGFTYMAQNGLTVADVFDKLTGSFDKNAKALQGVNNEAIKNAGAEIATMKALAAVARDETASRKERLAAVMKLQDEYPAYFGNLSKEQILTGNVTGAVKEVTLALIQKAKAQILANKIAENDLKILELQQKGEKELLTRGSRNASLGVLVGGVIKSFGALSDKVFGSTAEEVANLKKQQTLLTDELKNSTKAAVAFDSANKKASAKPKKQKAPENLKAVTGLEVSLGADDLNDRILKSFRDNLSTDLNNLKKDKIVLDIPIQPVVSTADFDAMIGKLSQFDIAANEIIQGSIASTFQGLGTVIGDAMASGGNILQAAGSALLSGIGGLLSDMGDMLIKMGTAAVLAGTVVKLFGSVTGIGAGLAAIAGGIVLKGIGGGIKSSASGATNDNNTGASFQSPTSSASSNGGGSFGGGTVVFEIAGQKLIGVLQNTLDKNKRLGGALGLG